MITLAVSDLERALAFYRDGLGLQTPGVIGTEFVDHETGASGTAAMFDLHGGLTRPVPGPWRRTPAFHRSAQSGGFSLGHLVPSKGDVDALLAQAEEAGATLIGKPYERPWGIYSGFFRDLDGHLWEVIWNPRVDSAESM